MIASDYNRDGTEADALHALPLDTEECAECERTASMLGRALAMVVAVIVGAAALLVLMFVVRQAGGN